MIHNDRKQGLLVISSLRNIATDLRCSLLEDDFIETMNGAMQYYSAEIENRVASVREMREIEASYMPFPINTTRTMFSVTKFRDVKSTVKK